MPSIHVADKNTNSLQKTGHRKYWKVPKLSSFEFRPPSWTSEAILNLTKKSSMEYVGLKYKPKSKNRTQKCSKLTEFWSKNPFFSHLENRHHFENL
jgi:hypothetical protein